MTGSVSAWAGRGAVVRGEIHEGRAGRKEDLQEGPEVGLKTDRPVPSLRARVAGFVLVLILAAAMGMGLLRVGGVSLPWIMGMWECHPWFIRKGMDEMTVRRLYGEPTKEVRDVDELLGLAGRVPRRRSSGKVLFYEGAPV